MKKLIIRKNKRFFQLLEVLIALFLVASCAVPIMGSYVYIYKEHKSMHQKIEMDHLAHLAHAKVVEDLYKKGADGMPLKEFLDKEIPVPMQDLNPDLILPYEFVYKLSINSPRKGKARDKTNRVLLNLTINPKHKNDPAAIYQHGYNYLIALKLDYKEGQDNGLPNTGSTIKKDEEKPKETVDPKKVPKPPRPTRKKP